MARETMMRLRRLLYRAWPHRWGRSILELLRGVRIHWSAELLAGRRQILLGRRTVVGARTRLVPGSAGVVSIESGVWLSSDIEIQTDTKVVIGSGTTVQRRCTINGSTRIGRWCLLAPNVFISSGGHPFRVAPHLHIREQEGLAANSAIDPNDLDRPVWIQDDCWLGVNSVVSPGVTVGKGSVVGANAVVTRDVPPYSVVAGVPARVISARLPWVPPTRIDVERDEDLVYILAGFIAGKGPGQGRRIVVTADEPLLAALAQPVRAVSVHYRASRNLEVEIGGVRVSVQEGENWLVVPTAGLPARYGALMFELTVVRAAAYGVLKVSCLKSVDVAEAVK